MSIILDIYNKKDFWIYITKKIFTNEFKQACIDVVDKWHMDQLSVNKHLIEFCYDYFKHVPDTKWSYIDLTDFYEKKNITY